MCHGWGRPGKVYIFDGVDADDATSMHERVALCYAWAERHGLAVLDEIICWAPRHNPDRGQALDCAVAACRRDRAALLVHSDAVLPADRPALARLAPLPLWTLDPTPGRPMKGARCHGMSSRRARRPGAGRRSRGST